MNPNDLPLPLPGTQPVPPVEAMPIVSDLLKQMNGLIAETGSKKADDHVAALTKVVEKFNASQDRLIAEIVYTEAQDTGEFTIGLRLLRYYLH